MILSKVENRVDDSGTSFQRICIRELRLFPFVLACARSRLLARRSASPSGWGWVVSLPGWNWTLFEAFGLLLAIVATVLGVVEAKLWRIALPVAFLMFLLTMYIMGS